MNVTVDVQGQKLRVLQNKKEFVAGSQKFVRFQFTLDEDWDKLMKFAQFRQNGVAYNSYLDEENSAYLPTEIGEGTCTMMLYGSGGEVIGTTNYITFTIDKNILISDASSTDISESHQAKCIVKLERSECVRSCRSRQRVAASDQSEGETVRSGSRGDKSSDSRKEKCRCNYA